MSGTGVGGERGTQACLQMTETFGKRFLRAFSENRGYFRLYILLSRPIGAAVVPPLVILCRVAVPSL